ncbi:MAG: DUF120 domain-containing protein [archaeon]|nr:DUF120 domain-containing protein [archaeon]
MGEKHIFTLRKIALLGGIDGYVAISSRELSDILGVSQQSASKKILELLDEKLIVRNLGAKKQRIKITDKGIKELKKVYNEYHHIFELDDHVIIHGRVTNGMGEGGHYICQPQYMQQFKKILGFSPFEGTFNLAIDEDDIDKFEIIKGSPGYRINGFVDKCISFGNVVAYKAKIHNMSCAVVIPEKSHYKEIIEIICQYHLRRTLGLNNGDRIAVKVEI